jgi:glycosyltransferase involved in cell wall biosynthesis
MMNVLVLSYEFPPLGGGGSSVVFHISKELVNLGHKVDIVTMGFRGLPENCIDHGIRVYRLKCVRRKEQLCRTHEMLSYILSGRLFLPKLLKRKNYDVCHCHFIVPSGLLALWLKKKFSIDYIITAHGSDVPTYNPDRFYIEHKFTKPILRLICENAKAICSPSLYLERLMQKKIGPYNIKHIPNGIDLENFKLNFSKSKEYLILTTGRLLKRKGFQTLIKAVHDIEMPFEVHIAGDGPYRSNLEEMAKGSKTKIIFHGWIEKGSDQLRKLYEKALIYVLVSASENASISLLEAMAAKTAIITTNVSGCPETIGNAGFLIEYDDDRRLRDILLQLSNDIKLIEAYANKAYNRLLDKFLWEDIVKDYIKLF